jgi:uncharacterized protein with von Willebrand factor type A (vWA) domain
VSSLLRNLLHFGRHLRSLGLDVQAGRMLDVASALEHVDIGRRTDFYFTLRALLVHRQRDLALFDEAFRVFWRRPPGEWSSEDLRALGERRRLGPPQRDAPAVEPRSSDDRSAGTPGDETVDGIAPASYSSREVSRIKDFARFTEEELKQAKAMIAEFRWDLGRRRTRRWAPGRSGMPDLRRVVRRNLRYGGEPLTLPRRDRVSKRRPLVLLCDVSGSMERYARMLLHFIHSLARGLDRVEAFLFATRLTRITREIGRRGVDEAVPKIQRGMPDWAGGTRIGEALRTFNVGWARRVLGRGPIVLLISDGWDRGDPDLLQGEMGRLQRSCHRLIWLNPLLGSAAYQPLTRGMQAALPFIDDFLPVHNLASLERLAEHLNALPTRRAARRGRAAIGNAARIRNAPRPSA